MTFRIILSGTPASGKGTQANNIVEKYGVKHLSVGKLFRDAYAKGTEVGKKAYGYWSSGKIVPEDLVGQLVQEQLNTPEVLEKGYLLDGFPLKGLTIKPTHVFFLSVPEDIWTERALGRREDPVTKTMYHLKWNPPPAGEVANRVVRRKDDNEKTVKNRQRELHENVDSFLEKYRETLVVVNGNQSPSEVFGEVDRYLSLGVTAFEGIPSVHSPRVLDAIRSPGFDRASGQGVGGGAGAGAGSSKICSPDESCAGDVACEQIVNPRADSAGEQIAEDEEK